MLKVLIELDFPALDLPAKAISTPASTGNSLKLFTEIVNFAFCKKGMVFPYFMSNNAITLNLIWLECLINLFRK
ncbi:hypothetical protein MB2181_00220 [Methylophilales bacterium HTCC2181]|uniref:Uncharacterized protein n=1 Tax=Methylophilales bacterium HTCC2181 TaxID=383631 RepID=A0P4J1_9PROT|nr:hypothetical protein MB2181_00220 [Methylophilales bacterium HTCC2181]